MIKTINAWRGIFAIVIVMFHSKVHLMDQAVTLGVSFFFVASGFLLTLRHRDKDLTAPGVWRNFLWNRAKRIYPIHWIALACYVVLYLWLKDKPLDLPELITEAALMHCWVPDKHYFFAYNGVSWFLGALLFHYACFPLINKYFSRLRLRWQVLFMVAVMGAFAWMLKVIPSNWITYTYVCPIVRLGDFMMGVTAANAFSKVTASRLNITAFPATIIEIITICIALVVIVINRTSDLVSLWGNYLIWWIPATIIVFSFSLLDKQEGYIGRVLLTRPFQFLGTLSMEIYLFQSVAAFIVNYYISPIYGHFGYSIYNQYVYTQVPLLIFMSWTIHKARKIKKSHSSLQ